MDKLTSKRGMMLLLSLFVVAFSGLYVTVGMTRAVTESRVAGQFNHATRAMQAAEAASDNVLYQMRRSTNQNSWTPAGTPTTLANGKVTFGTNWYGTTPAAEVVVSGAGNRFRQFTAHGFSGGIEKKLRFVIEVPPLIGAGGPAGVVGLSYVEVQDPTMLDAWDSSTGAYLSHGSSALPNGTYDVIRTDSIATGRLKFATPADPNNATVYGNIVVGPGLNAAGIDAVIEEGSHPPTEYGSRTSASPLALAAVTPASSAETDGSVSRSYTFGAGGKTVYYLKDLNVTNASLTTSGGTPITVHVNGKLNFAGTTSLTGNTKITFIVNRQFDINTTGTIGIATAGVIANDPTKLRFDLAGTDQAKINQPSIVNGLIYGPTREINIDGAGSVEIFGGIVGDEVIFSANQNLIHADVRLSTGGGPIGGPGTTEPKIRFWQEIP